jgi:hypothetical protein
MGKSSINEKFEQFLNDEECMKNSSTDDNNGLKKSISVARFGSQTLSNISPFPTIEKNAYNSETIADRR